eukprot:TRINITY_DN1153_c0_g1_i3.p1 TRINITY_DN1153_c0_g1~~TRINITY_DN1153_c0_g1_i3.p1  ORF type:complete len:252 (-),score=102.86 TRINITY_DN1153_c0_g1_i3:64-819(-)
MHDDLAILENKKKQESYGTEIMNFFLFKREDGFPKFCQTDAEQELARKTKLLLEKMGDVSKIVAEVREKREVAAERDEALHKAEELQKQLTKLQEELSRDTGRLEEKDKALAQQRQQHKLELELKDKESENERKKVKQLQKEIRERDAKINASEATTAAAVQQQKKHEDVHKSLEVQHEQQKKQIAELQKNLEQALADAAEAKGRADRLLSEKAAAEAELLALRQNAKEQAESDWQKNLALAQLAAEEADF